jgi:outer membrane protein assembly factor BamB
MRPTDPDCRSPRGAVWRWSLAALLALATPAWAVVPGLTGPLQALLQMLPQILPFVAAAAAGALSIPAWRERIGRAARWLVTGPGLVSLGVIAAALAATVFLAQSDRSRPAVAAPPPARGADWPMFRGNLERTGAAAGARGPTAPRVAWTFSDPEVQVADLSASPAVVGGRVYLASAQASVFDSSGMVYCLDAATGKRIWQFQTEKQGFSSPSVVGGRVYVGEGLHVDAGCRLYCLDAATGRRLWATVTKSHTESSPAVVGGRVYTGAGEDGVYCLDAANGKVLWHRGAMHVDTCPAVGSGRVYTGTGYGRLQALALDAAGGKTVWAAPCDLPVWGPPAVVGARVYYGIGNGDFVHSAPQPRGGVWCLDAATGRQIWRRSLPDAVLTAVVHAAGRLFVGCRDGRAYALDATTGAIAWSTALGGPIVASPAWDGKNLYVAGGKGVTCLDPATGKIRWDLDLTLHTAPELQLFSSPAVAGGRLFLGTSREKLICVGE